MRLKKMLAVTRRMSAVQRFSQTKLVNAESVLEHQGAVSFFAYCIGYKLIVSGEPLNQLDVIVPSIVHDIDEIFTGDVPRPTKYANEVIRQSLEGLAKNSVYALSEEMELPMLSLDWEFAKSGKEGSIVGLCDIISVLYKVWEEVCLYGNLTIVDHAGPIDRVLSKKFTEAKEHMTRESSKLILTELHYECSVLLSEIHNRSYPGEY